MVPFKVAVLKSSEIRINGCAEFGSRLGNRPSADTETCPWPLLDKRTEMQIHLYLYNLLFLTIIIHFNYYQTNSDYFIFCFNRCSLKSDKLNEIWIILRRGERNINISSVARHEDPKKAGAESRLSHLYASSEDECPWYL